MKYNKNWERWIKASVARHYKSDITHTYVEGFERDTDGLNEWIEIRLDGPYYKQMSKNDWKLNVEVNILVVCNGSSNAYRTEEIKGDVAEKFTDCLEIFRLGNKEPDDSTLLGCMRLIQSGRDKIVTTNFGRLRPDTNQYQASVEGHYEMLLND